jgi:hypothetical protein
VNVYLTGGKYANYENVNLSFAVNGKVGYRLNLAAPTAGCITETGSHHGNWSVNVQMVSGALPDGLTLAGDGGITGVPTKRGHFYSKLRFSNYTCNGVAKNYPDDYEEIIFHITGTGEVIPD